MEYILIQIDKKFLNFYEIVDDYLNNIFLSTYKSNQFIQNLNNSVYKFCYDCEYGSIEFVRDFNNLNKKKIIVHEIYIGYQYRNQGLCKEFIKYLIDKSYEKNTIVIQSVLSKILYNFLLRFEHRGKKFIIKKKEGFVMDF